MNPPRVKILNPEIMDKWNESVAQEFHYCFDLGWYQGEQEGDFHFITIDPEGSNGFLFIYNEFDFIEDAPVIGRKVRITGEERDLFKNYIGICGTIVLYNKYGDNRYGIVSPEFGNPGECCIEYVSAYSPIEVGGWLFSLENFEVIE